MEKRQVHISVVDFAKLPNGQVKLFEFGRGICGSGFPEYDFSHPPLEYTSSLDDPHTRSPMRQLMVRELAQSFDFVYIVNVQCNQLSQCLGQEFFEKFSNVKKFQTPAAFFEYCRDEGIKQQKAVVIIDRLGSGLNLTEDDFAEWLSKAGIKLPVVNAGSYHLYDNKLFFAELCEGELKTYIPQTWLVNPENSAAILEQIKASGVSHFVLKLNVSAHARDTVILDFNELKKLLPLLNRDHIEKAKSLALSATKQKCFEYFLSQLDYTGFAFVIRELVQPEPVQWKKDRYIAAGRAVFLTCFDSASRQFEIFKPLALYWQFAALPFVQGSPLQHDRLITSDIQSVNIESSRSTVVALGAREFTNIEEEFRHSTDLTPDQSQQVLPQLELMMRNLFGRIIPKSKMQVIQEALQDTNPAIKRVAFSVLCGFPVSGSDENNLPKVKQRLGDIYPTMIARQFLCQLRLYRFWPNCELIPLHLAREFNHFCKPTDPLVQSTLAEFPREIRSMSAQAREKLSDWSAKKCPLLARLIHSSALNAEKHLAAAKTYKSAALEVYKERPGDAKRLWLAELSEYKKICFICPEMVICYSNLASVCRNMQDYDLALQYCGLGFTCAEELGVGENQDLLRKKYREIQELKTKQVVQDEEDSIALRMK